MAEISALGGGFRPFTSLIGGAAAGQQLVKGYQENEARRLGIEDYTGKRSALKSYAETGDTTELKGYDPELAMKIENNLISMDVAKREAAVKRLTAGIDVTDKALPYIVAASKTNPQAAAAMWPEYLADLRRAGIQPPPYMEQYSTDALNVVWKQKEDLKTAVARINAAGRLQYGELMSDARIEAANIRKAGVIEAAEITARGRAAGKAGSTRFPSYADYKADVRAGKHPDLPADAPEEDIIRGFNAAIEGGKAGGKAEFPKLMTPAEELLWKATHPGEPLPTNTRQPGGTRQPGRASQPTAVRTYVVRDKQGRDVTNTLTDDQYNEVLKRRGVK